MLRISIIALSTLVLAAGGCARTGPARFYTLQALTPAREATEARTFVLAVGPMTISTHLDRPHIATRVGPHEIAYDHYNRWAEPLKDSIPTVLSDNLRAALPEADIIQYPGSETLSFSYRAMVQVIRLDATPGKEANLRAGWMIMPSEGESPLATGMFDKGVAVAATDYAAIVDAESQLLAQLAADIAAAVRTAHAAAPVTKE